MTAVTDHGGNKEASVAQFFAFPNPVNEIAARLVAAGVVLMSVATLAFRQPSGLVPISYGFFAPVLTGPSLSPLGQLVTRVIVPRLHLAERPVAGPPKRFAQAMGFVMSTTAAVLALGFGYRTAGFVLTGLIVVAATLESGFGLCLGCKVFAVLMRVGVVRAEVCERCHNIWAGRPEVRRT
jgi:Domain of unknown function (DUF4395)